MTKKSRFEEISRKKSERNIFLILLGIIIFLVVFFFYGVPLLINLTLLILNLKNGNDSGTINNDSYYIAPPVLDPLPDATNSAKISISGNVADKETIKIYLNDKYLKEIDSTDNKSFVFNDITLQPGENNIKTKAVNSEKKESDYSQNINITYKNKAPSLDIHTPQDNQSFSGNSQIKIEGKSDPGVRVTINGYWAIVDNQGNFSYLLNLQKGDNNIKITAVDDAGNQNEKQLKATLNQ